MIKELNKGYCLKFLSPSIGYIKIDGWTMYNPEDGKVIYIDNYNKLSETHCPILLIYKKTT